MHSFVRYSIIKWLVEIDDNLVHKFSVISKTAVDTNDESAVCFNKEVQ